ncbi:MAG: 16S rRNA (guanine(966)-N(2))-methyltransferase RsmD [Nitrospirae bacterium]|nr:16S rRNA (guanine(966)-N(2))-methyltransferase RsmD [Nitrospirota bacterium]
MRVISGIARGRKIRAPKGMELRPTSDRVKESLFNIIRDRVEGCRFLDLFSGTGNIGIEAISRGAAWVTFVERDPRFLKSIRENLSLIGLESGCEIISSGAAEYIKKGAKEGKQFNIIFVDPPYKSDILEKEIFPLLGETEILAKGGVVVVEHYSKKKLPDGAGKLIHGDDYRYGDTMLSLYESSNSEEVLRG